jgi:LDH2 family malate/lactate/ureidoglycolate dehydrogenase
MHVTNGVPLGCSLFSPVSTVYCVETLKVLAAVLGGFGNAGDEVEVVKGGVFQGNCHFVLAIDPSQFEERGDLARFSSRMRTYCDGIGGTFPGKRAGAVQKESAAKGIAVPVVLAEKLRVLAQEKGVPVPF